MVVVAGNWIHVHVVHVHVVHIDAVHVVHVHIVHVHIVHVHVVIHIHVEEAIEIISVHNVGGSVDDGSS